MSLDRQDVTRRSFVKVASTTAVGFTIALHLPSVQPGPLARLFGGEALAAGGDLAPNAFVRIAPDGLVTVLVKHLEMGQGVYTGLPMLVAEELEVDLAQVRVEAAPADAALYHNSLMGPIQATGGSTSLANSWDQLRQAGAAMREMLLSAAAEKLGKDRAKLRAEAGAVVDDEGHRTPYGELVELAAKQTPPKVIKLKDPKDFKLIGQSPVRLDGLAKTNGQAVFALDVRRPGQLTALVARPPAFGATLKSFDAAAAKAVPGVKAVVKIPQGVAVVAEGFWAAKQGREALKLDWDESATKAFSTEAQEKDYRQLLDRKGTSVVSVGNAEAALKKAAKKIDLTFTVPYLAHAPMEVLNCVVELTDGGADIWAGDQFQTIDQANAARVLGLSPGAVRIHTLLAGGSFGRRANAASDYITEACEIAKATKDLKAPIHAQWTREDDVAGGYYRPSFMHRVRAGIDRKGTIVAWDHRIVGQSIMGGTPFAAMMKDGIDPTSVEGVADLPYAVGALNVELHSPKQAVPVLWWRSVGHTHTAFVVESVLDELARLAGKDPVDYRLTLLGTKPRHQAALKLAVDKAGWHSPTPAGRFRGVAVHESFNTVVAQVAEVSLKDKSLRVERVVCAVDCGVAVNPDNIKAQMEGGIGFALGAALHGRVSFKGGRVEQSNFHDYPLLRLNEMPVVEVHIVPSQAHPTGVGEPGVPPLAPAVANALAKATGERPLGLPFKLPS